MEINNGPYKIYILTNNINNKIYIGVTKKSLNDRFRKGKGYTHQKDFYNDICKYGWENFSWEIFASNLIEEEAFNMEKLLIEKIREQDQSILYNRDAGGKHGKHCQETKDIIQEINIGRVITEEAKEKIRAARAKQVFSEESITKRALKMRGRKMSPEFCKKLGERSSKKVLCIENGIVYKSATEASKELHVSLSGISMHCKGVYSSVKGLHFKYV